MCKEKKYKKTLTDNILLVIVNKDPHTIIRDIGANIGFWCSAHLTDLLYHCNMLEKEMLPFGTDVREYFLLSYGSSLQSTYGMWQITAQYYKYCPKLGRRYLEELIDHESVDTEKKAMKLVAFCERSGLDDSSKDVCRRFAMRKMQEGCYGSCVYWLVRAKDYAKLADITDKLLDNFYQKGISEDIENAVNHLGFDAAIDPKQEKSPNILIEKFAFMKLYKQLTSCWEQRNYNQAASTIVELLMSKQTPRKFWLSLLIEAVPILEAKEIYFNNKETLQLMNCLEQICISHRKKEYLDARGISEEQIQVIRLALARNLAKSII